VLRVPDPAFLPIEPITFVVAEGFFLSHPSAIHPTDPSVGGKIGRQEPRFLGRRLPNEDEVHSSPAGILEDLGFSGEDRNGSLFQKALDGLFGGSGQPNANVLLKSKEERQSESAGGV